MKPQMIRVGLLGFGTVGSGVYRMMRDNADSITRHIGSPAEIVKIGVRDLSKSREFALDNLTNDLESIVDDPAIDVIIEVMGGVSPARELIERALASKKHVITANKELIAKHGAALMKQAALHSLDLHFEAAVGGGIPLVQPLKHQLAGNDVLKMMGILNGTTNYILTQMTEKKQAFSVALADAQELGYAEADPSADVEGFDAQYKLAILSTIAFSQEIPVESVYREGITKITADDIHFARILGYRIKILGIVEALPDGILARVHPVLLPRRFPLANVHDVYNAVQIRGDFVGDVILSGRGAGSAPTASSVIGDLIDVGRNIRLGGAGNVTMPDSGGLPLLPIEKLETAYYLRMLVDDQPKVLGSIALHLGEYGVSLAAMEMRVVSEQDKIGEIVFLTHVCNEGMFRKAISVLEGEPVVKEICSWIRVES
ncbi:MAG: homoserine dehydrogenase [Fimbriimonadaceae bacterium]